MLAVIYVCYKLKMEFATGNQLVALSARDQMIFVSHSSKDDEFVTQLHVALRRRGFATWVDHISNIPAGVFWDEALDEALSNCNVMILSCRMRLSNRKPLVQSGGSSLRIRRGSSP